MKHKSFLNFSLLNVLGILFLFKFVKRFYNFFIQSVLNSFLNIMLVYLTQIYLQCICVSIVHIYKSFLIIVNLNYK